VASSMEGQCMKITASVDELLVHFPNLNAAVGILVKGVKEKDYGALADWYEFRKKDAKQNNNDTVEE
jgi:hypothetical protein